MTTTTIIIIIIIFIIIVSNVQLTICIAGLALARLFQLSKEGKKRGVCVLRR